MKNFLPLLLIFIFVNTSAQELHELPFFDDFEETISEDATFQNWTTENLEGWHYWHIIPWGGIGEGQCMRFENTDLNQNDWLISNPINTKEPDTIQINFNHFYHTSGTKPKLLYTSNYNGDVSQSNWTEIEYSLGDNQNEWNSSEKIIIEAPGDTIWFAFHYQAAANEGIYFLLDNFSVKKYIPPPIYELVGSTEHFEFYSAKENSTYWDSISPFVDNWINELSSYWNRPGTDSLFYSDDKTNITLMDKNTFEEQLNNDVPDWKLGAIKNSNKIYVTIPKINDKNIYKGSFITLVKNTFGQLAFTKWWSLIHDGSEPPDFLTESFGLYYSGYKPNRDSIVKIIDEMGRLPVLSDIINIYDTDFIHSRDLFYTYIESQILKDSYQNIYPGKEYLWQIALKHFYLNDYKSRISLYKSSSNFDFYCVPSDSIYLDTMSVKLEHLLIQYAEPFNLKINHNFNVIIYPNLEMAKEINGNYSMGSAPGGDNFNMLSPSQSENPMKAASGGLIAHEFAHVIHYLMMPYNGFPNVYFIMEGFADYLPLGTINMKMIDDLWKIDQLFYRYHRDYDREPYLADIMESTKAELDLYLFGQIFYNSLIPDMASYTELKSFFCSGCDWSEFSLTYEKIDESYITYLKSLVDFIPDDKLVDIPINESFDNFSNGWSKPSYTNPDNWQIDDGGKNGNCARFYTHSNKNEPIESWLVSPALNAENMNEVKLSFDFSRSGEGIELEVFYTDSFEGYTDSTNWTSLKSIEMPTDWNWSNTGEITINNPHDTLYIGIRMKSTGEQHQQLSIDNFEVDGTITNSELIESMENNFNIYPNPATSESIISFQTKNSRNLNLSVFDIHGRKITTILNKTLPAGNHNYPLGKNIPSNGIYFLRLKTEEGVSTQKFVFTNK